MRIDKVNVAYVKNIMDHMNTKTNCLEGCEHCLFLGKEGCTFNDLQGLLDKMVKRGRKHLGTVSRETIRKRGGVTGGTENHD